MRITHFPSRFQLAAKFILGFSVLMIFAVAPVAAQDVCANCGSTYQSPVARSGGPYIGMTGQTIQMNGWDSWSDGGWITGYYWDFGDGTSGSGPNPNHQYNADGVYTVSLWVSDSDGNWASSQSFEMVLSMPQTLSMGLELPVSVLRSARSLISAKS